MNNNWVTKLEKIRLSQKYFVIAGLTRNCEAIDLVNILIINLYFGYVDFQLQEIPRQARMTGLLRQPYIFITAGHQPAAFCNQMQNAASKE